MDRAPVFGSPLVLGCLGRSFLAQVRPPKKNWPESEGLVQTADPAGCCAISSVRRIFLFPTLQTIYHGRIESLFYMKTLFLKPRFPVDFSDNDPNASACSTASHPPVGRSGYPCASASATCCNFNLARAKFCRQPAYLGKRLRRAAFFWFLGARMLRTGLTAWDNGSTELWIHHDTPIYREHDIST